MLTEIRAKPRWKHKPDDRADADVREDDGSGGDTAIVCVRCDYEITNTSQKIRVQDLHEHSQVNPGGFIWNFRCFRTAPGCVPLGVPSSEFPWFAGYTWQIQHCGGCNLHLGWSFASTDDRFFGLITERIVEVERSKDS